MSVHKTVEISAESAKSWSDATEEAVKEAAKTIKGIRSVWIKDMSGEVGDDGEITKYRVNCKITFEVK